MTVILRSISVAALLTVALLGCDTGVALNGHWIGYRKLEAPPGSDAALIKTVSKVDLNIHDGRFTLLDRGMAKKGELIVENGAFSLTVTDIALSNLAKPIEHAYNLVLDEDGVTLTGPEEEGDPVQLKPQEPTP